MKIESTPFEGLKIITPECYQDKRGYFYESWQAKRFVDVGLNVDFVQDNLSYSKKNVVRGMHFQVKSAFDQLVTVTLGTIFDVVVDLRQASPSFGQWFGLELDASKVQQLYIPAGFAHGFCVLSIDAMVQYKCTGYYHPQDEGGLHWQSVNIPWPVKNPIISDKDAHLKPFQELTDQELPRYGEDQYAHAL